MNSTIQKCGQTKKQRIQINKQKNKHQSPRSTTMIGGGLYHFCTSLTFSDQRLTSLLGSPENFGKMQSRWYYYYYIRLTNFSQDNLSKTAPER